MDVSHRSRRFPWRQCLWFHDCFRILSFGLDFHSHSLNRFRRLSASQGNRKTGHAASGSSLRGAMVLFCLALASMRLIPIISSWGYVTWELLSNGASVLHRGNLACRPVFKAARYFAWAGAGRKGAGNKSSYGPQGAHRSVAQRCGWRSRPGLRVSFDGHNSNSGRQSR